MGRYVAAALWCIGGGAAVCAGEHAGKERDMKPMTWRLIVVAALWPIIAAVAVVMSAASSRKKG